MEVSILQDHLAPNGTADGVTLYKNVSTDTICYKNKRGVILPLGSSGGTVFDNVIATGTTALDTSTTLSYGVNVFTTITSTNRAAKLPAAITGQIVIVVNNTTSALTLYPSMVGGSINGVVDGVATVPPDGKPYSFYCIKNPLPGAWTWSAPATNQYDSGIISVTLSSGSITPGNTNPYVSAYDNTYKNIIASTNTYAAGNGSKGAFNILGVPGTGSVANQSIYFQPTIPWNSITKIKVYTNASVASSYYIAVNGEIDLYEINSNPINMIANEQSVAAVYWNNDTNNVIPGTPINSGEIQPYIGAPGTYWGELIIPNSTMTSTNAPGNNISTSIIGAVDQGDIMYPYTNSSYIGQLVNRYYNCFMSFMIHPMKTTNYGSNQTFEFRFIIEHT